MKLSLIRIERLLARLNKIWMNVRGKSGQLYVWDRIEEYNTMWTAVAKQLGAEITLLADDIWQISLNGKKTRILNDKLEYDNPVNLIMAGRKPLVYKMLADTGLRVPDHTVYSIDDLTPALRFLKEHPLGCVVKPADGTCSGQGVTTHITTEKEIRKASILASLYCGDLLIESMVAGECYRLLVLKGKVIHAVCRRGIHLFGDGSSTISELMKKKGFSIDMDKDSLFTLNFQDLTLDTVPSDGLYILLKSRDDSNQNNIELRTVYNSDVTDIVCDSIKQDAISAAKTLGCDFVGVDFIMTNPEISLFKSGGCINEINTTPGLHHHCGHDKKEYSQIALQVISPLLH